MKILCYSKRYEGKNMNYKNTIRGIFKDRPNRFIAHVQIGDQLETVHVKNTGRCRELLVPETEVILEKSDNPARKTNGNSRFDLYVESEERKAFIEVKGVTLEENDIVRFPDAPTERGIKHLHELMKAASDGYEAYLLLVIQMKDVRYFEPNRETHPKFGETLKEAADAGVYILAYDCAITEDSMKICDPVPVKL